MRAGETVGVLMDTNMTPPQGVFVDFFGHAACTASGVARVALRTGAKVLPGFLVWQPAEKKYVLTFCRAKLVDTGDAERDATANTQVFTTALENVIGNFRSGLWVHRRWKTLPPENRRSIKKRMDARSHQHARGRKAQSWIHSNQAVERSTGQAHFRRTGMKTVLAVMLLATSALAQGCRVRPMWRVGSRT